MATIADVVKMWNARMQENTNLQVYKVDGGVGFIRLSTNPSVDRQDIKSAVHYLFIEGAGEGDFKVRFQIDKNYAYSNANSEKVCKFLEKNFRGQKVYNKRVKFWTDGNGSPNYFLKLGVCDLNGKPQLNGFPSSSSAKELCDAMEQFIKLTQEKITKYLLTGKED